MAVNRRRVLTAVGGSVSITGISTLVGARGPNTVAIPVLRDPNGVRAWESVPESWHQHRHRARTVKEEMANRCTGNPAVDQIGLTRSSEKLDGKNKLEVEVEVWPEKGPVSLPDEIDGVNITTTEAKKSHLVDNCYNYDTIFYDVPGGVKANVVGNEPIGSGTLCCKVNDYYSSSTEKKLLTASHIATNDRCNDDLNGREIFMSDDSTSKKVGEIVNYDHQADWAIVEITNSEFNYSNQIKLESSTRIDVEGWVTQSGLESFVGSENVKKMGIATGKTSGNLSKIGLTSTCDSDDSCTDWNGNGFRSKTTTAEGDSGGPAWYTNDKGNHFIVGIIQKACNRDWFDSACEGSDLYEESQGYEAEAFVDTTFYDFGSLS